jgi:hypothetical protein
MFSKFDIILQPRWYNWNIVESGVKHHNPTHPPLFCIVINKSDEVDRIRRL